MPSLGVTLSLCLSLLTLLTFFPPPVTPKKKPDKDKETQLKDLIVCKTCLFIEAKEGASTVDAALVSGAETALNRAFEVGVSTKICIDKPKSAKNKTTKKVPKKIPMCISWAATFLDKKIEIRFGIPIDPNATIKTRGSSSAREVEDGDCTGSVEGLGFPGGGLLAPALNKMSDLDICLCNNDNECNDGRARSSSFNFPLSALILPAILILSKIRPGSEQ